MVPKGTNISELWAFSSQWEGRWQWGWATFPGRWWAAGPREVPKPSLPGWGQSVRMLFSRYIFSSLVHNGNLNKRFELQSRLTQHIPWAMTAIYVKKIKKERASGSTWAGVTECKGKQAIEAASWKWEAYPAETKLKKATMTKEIWFKKKKVGCYYWKVECFVPATRQYRSQKPNNDQSSPLFPWLLACLALPCSQPVNRAWGGTRYVGGGDVEMWGWGNPCPRVVSPLSPPLLLHLSHSSFAFSFLLFWCPSFPPCPSLHPSLPPSHYFSFSLAPPSPLPSSPSLSCASPFPTSLSLSLSACAVLLMCSNGMAGKSFALPFSLFFSRSIIKTAPSLAVMGASVFSPSPVSLTWHNACPHQDAITPR